MRAVGLGNPLPPPQVEHDQEQEEDGGPEGERRGVDERDVVGIQAPAEAGEAGAEGERLELVGFRGLAEGLGGQLVLTDRDQATDSSASETAIALMSGASRWARRSGR